MVNKTFRLFVSSTFSDFISERSVLNDNVFPSVNHFCEQKGYDFQLIDLRWGVNNESSLQHNTIDICLNEVRRCKRLSPKPNFLIMIGERYGWIPLPTIIERTLFERIVQSGDNTEKDVLTRWYKLDENYIDGKYVLIERTDEYIDDCNWFKEEELIRDTLIQCARKGNISEEIIDGFTVSATEKEIIEGLFTDTDVCDNTIAFLRTSFPDKDPSLEKINLLKKKIVERMSRDNCSGNIVEMQYSNNKEYLEEFRNAIEALLISNISEEIDRIDNLKEELSDLEVLQEVYGEKSFFKTREKDICNILALLENNKQKPLFLTGESGSGKTTLLAELVKKTETDVFFGFFGLDQDSYNLIDVLKKICERIRIKYNTELPLQLTANNISEVFHNALYSIPASDEALLAHMSVTRMQLMQHS